MHENFDFKTSAFSAKVSVKFATKQTQLYHVLFNALSQTSHYVGYFFDLLITNW